MNDDLYKNPMERREQAKFLSNQNPAVKELQRHIIENYFELYELPDAQERLWNMLKMALGSESEEADASDRRSMMRYYESTAELLEALHLLFISQHALPDNEG